MPLVVEFVKGRTKRMVVFQMKIVNFGFRRGVPTIFTHIHLWKEKKAWSMMNKVFLSVNVPLTSSACNRIGEPHRELWGNGTPMNSVEWMTSHRDCTCRVERLKRKRKWKWLSNGKMISHYQYEFVYVVSDQRCHWILCRRKCTGNAWYHCGTSCVDSVVVASWRFWSRVCIGIWMGPTLVWQEAVSLSEQALLPGPPTGDSWSRGLHWWVRWEHRVGFPTGW